MPVKRTLRQEALEIISSDTDGLKNMDYSAKAMKAAYNTTNIDNVGELMQGVADW